MGKPMLGPVDDGAVGEERSQACSHRTVNGLPTANIQVGLLLAGKGGARQVLGGCTGTNRDVGSLLLKA